MLDALFNTANAQNDRHRQLNACFFNPFGCFRHFFPCGTFVNLFQQFSVAGFHAQIKDFQPQLVQFLQFIN